MRFLRSRKVMFTGSGVAGMLGVGLIVIALTSSGGGDDRPPIEIVAVTEAPTAEPAPVTAEPTAAPIAPPLGDSAYRMVISKIGVDAPVETYGLDEQQIPQIPSGDNAGQVVAWYNFSAKPGTGSNAVFAGHVTWYGGAVFSDLASVAVGDEIKLEGDDGTELVYKVSDTFLVSADDPNGPGVMLATADDVVTIITCEGTFTKDPNDHVAGGHYSDRLIVRASLQSPAAAHGVSGAG